jgi:hypothetical protein
MNSKKPVELASCGQYSQINWKRLTVKDITEFDDLGYTLLHHCARHSQWQSLPIKLRDPKYWQEARDGDTIYMAAYYSADQSWVNTSQLTKKDILKRNKEGKFLALLATHNKTLHTLPKSLITREVILEKVQEAQTNLNKKNTPHKSKLDSKNLLIHEIARYGQISAIPKNLLSEKLLSIKGTSGESVYHILAQEEQAEEIPKNLWTRDALTLKSPQGVTPLHYIVRQGADVMPETITLKDFLNETIIGETPLHSWAKSSYWISIPDKYLTQETLGLKGSFKESILEIILDNYQNGWASREPEFNEFMGSKISYALSQAKDSTFKEISKNPAPAIQPLVKNELIKRKLVKKISRGVNSLEI